MLTSMGCCCFDMLRRWRSDSLTVIKTPAGIDSNKIVKNAYSRYNLSIGIGLSQVSAAVVSGCGCMQNKCTVGAGLFTSMVVMVHAGATGVC